MPAEPVSHAVPVDLSRPRRIHVVAVGGAGMSGIATVLAEAGHTVSGSDAADSPVLQRLAAIGVRAVVGHDPAHVGDAEFVVASTAVADDNPELAEARRRGIPVLRRLDLLPALARRQPFVSVAGTHGKTTTSALLTVALKGAGEDPSYLVGAPVRSLGGAAAHRPGRWFVLEADESDGSFLAGPRAAALVTNLEPDHLEHWGGWEPLRDGFRRFLEETAGPRVLCGDDTEAARLARELAETGAHPAPVTYGCGDGADWRIVDEHLGAGGSRFTLEGPSGAVVVELPLPGHHNALDAAGALAVVGELGGDVAAAARALGSFGGVARRFEERGRAGGVTVVDDYAHLPTEVRAVLAAGRSGGWRRVVAVFQPHRYSRTQALWREFADAFDDADLLVLTELYAAGEPPRPGVSGKLVLDAVLERHPWRRVAWMPSLDDVVTYLGAELRHGDLCLTIGAGDVTTVGDRVLEILAGREREHRR
jgi:UDP-N-acetylmuramate--alanine ligase